MTDSVSSSAPASMMSHSSDNSLLKVALVMLTTLFWVVAWYWPTASQVAGIWWSYETFAHGLVVFPIAAWLIWVKRRNLVGLTPQPVPWMALPVAAATTGWLVAEFITVNALAHLSLMTALVLAFIGMLGWTIARRLAFPLGFLFFGVPMGEFLIPYLMDYTAIFTVWALRVTGVPVYQEGLFFVIPSGRWSVVEACSGIRYLIASLMVGTLFAYLNYTSLRRRLIFVGVAIAVPILANWMRAYLIVMIGHLTDNRLAAGVDHLLYGWVFFGIVIGLMFWIGSMWREDEVVSASATRTSSAAVDTRSSSVNAARAVPILVALVIAPLIWQEMDAPVEPYSVALAAPAPGPGWTAEDGVFFDYMPRFSGYRSSLYQIYRHEDGGVVALYVAYFADQRSGSQMVTSRNRLNFRDDSVPVNWQIVSRQSVDMPPGRVLRTMLSDAGRVLAAWHWFWSDGEIVTSDKLAKVKFAMKRLTARPDDAAFVLVLTPTGDRSEDAKPLVETFLRDHGAAIDAMLASAERDR